jgi:hypothetical protein
MDGIYVGIAVLLLLVLGWYAYTKGWFGGWFGSGAAASADKGGPSSAAITAGCGKLFSGSDVSACEAAGGHCTRAAKGYQEAKTSAEHRKAMEDAAKCICAVTRISPSGAAHAAQVIGGPRKPCVPGAVQARLRSGKVTDALDLLDTLPKLATWSKDVALAMPPCPAGSKYWAEAQSQGRSMIAAMRGAGQSGAAHAPSTAAHAPSTASPVGSDSSDGTGHLKYRLPSAQGSSPTSA